MAMGHDDQVTQVGHGWPVPWRSDGNGDDSHDSCGDDSGDGEEAW